MYCIFIICTWFRKGHLTTKVSLIKQPSVHMSVIQRRINIGAMPWRCFDVAATLLRRCVPVGADMYIEGQSKTYLQHNGWEHNVNCNVTEVLVNMTVLLFKRVGTLQLSSLCLPAATFQLLPGMCLILNVYHLNLYQNIMWAGLPKFRCSNVIA